MARTFKYPMPSPAGRWPCATPGILASGQLPSRRARASSKLRPSRFDAIMATNHNCTLSGISGRFVLRQASSSPRQRLPRRQARLRQSRQVPSRSAQVGHSSAGIGGVGQLLHRSSKAPEGSRGYRRKAGERHRPCCLSRRRDRLSSQPSAKGGGGAP